MTGNICFTVGPILLLISYHYPNSSLNQDLCSSSNLKMDRDLILVVVVDSCHLQFLFTVNWMYRNDKNKVKRGRKWFNFKNKHIITLK